MRDRTLKWLVAAAMAVLLPCSASAAGLGRLIVHSALGQPLNAEVELISVQKGETITARLASPETYQQAGAQYNNMLTGARVTLDRRPSGQQYLRVTTPRPITEPFLELLIEINSENGRVVRHYTALLDPPGYGRAAAEVPPPVARTEPSAPAAAATPLPPPTPPVAEGSLSAPQPPSAPARARKRAAVPPTAPKTVTTAEAGAQREYGPVKPGETLRKIARNVRPEGVSLEQTLVGLYRQNPDAFLNKNMNLVKSGKILRVPDAAEIAALAPRDASQEVRMQVADFNAYRNRVADRPATAPEAGSVRSGRIGTSRVTERGAPEVPRDTVRVSRGEPAKGKDAGRMNTAERLRALEEEVIAREKALAEANERIAQLEQIIKDTQRAIELKGGAAAGPKGAEKAAPAQPDSTVAIAPPVTPTAKPQEPPPPAKASPAESPAAGAAKDRTPTEAAPAAKAEPPAKAKAAAALEPATEPSFMSTLLDEPLYLAAGGVAVLLGGLAFMMVRRRRQAEADPYDSETIAPTFGGGSDGGVTEPTLGDSSIERAAAVRADSSAKSAQDVKIATASSATAPEALPSTPPTRSPSEDNDLDFDLVRRVGAPAGSSPSRESAQRDALSRNAPAALDRDTAARGFNLEPPPPVNAPLDMDKVSSEPPPSVDFKLDLNDLDVNAPSRQAPGGGGDDHWHDVQQKFDLAKAYQAMGDKGGARDILQEVMREGDKDQQAHAKKLLESLS